MSELPKSVLSGISFVGHGGGQVKALGGFKKSHHTLPDAANATTNAFLGKICTDELAAEAEALFQRVRAGLNYKRKEVSLSVTSPLAVLISKDFTLETLYALEEAEPSRYDVTHTLHSLRNAELARTAEFNDIFAGRFSEISFALKKGVKVEAVIDAIEGLKDSEGITVDYPSDCSECTVRVPEVTAEVRFTSATLDMIFPRAGAPGELMDAFAEVRGAFAVSKVLSAALG